MTRKQFLLMTVTPVIGLLGFGRKIKNVWQYSPASTTSKMVDENNQAFFRKLRKASQRLNDTDVPTTGRILWDGEKFRTSMGG